MTVCRTANRALDMVRGEFIARLDSDDVALPERFSQQLDFLEKNHEYILCGSNFQFIDQDGKVGKIRQLPETNGEIQNSFLIKNPIAQSALMIRTSMLGALRYDENFEVAEDLEFWMRLGFTYCDWVIFPSWRKIWNFGCASGLCTKCIIYKKFW